MVGPVSRREVPAILMKTTKSVLMCTVDVKVGKKGKHDGGKFIVTKLDTKTTGLHDHSLTRVLPFSFIDAYSLGFYVRNCTRF